MTRNGRLWVIVSLLGLTWTRGGSADPTPVATFDVVVLSAASGAPVANAQIELRTDVGPSITTYPATTDPQGRARFERIPLGAYALHASADGFVSAFVDRLDVKAAQPEVPIKLEVGIPLSGRVRDEAGKPVVHATLLVRAGGEIQGQKQHLPGRPPCAKVSSDEEGRFRIPGVPAVGISTVFVRARGHEDLRVAVRAEGGKMQPASLDLVLRPGGRVAGVVLDPDGKPLPRASVYVIPADAEGLKADPRVELERGDWSTACLDDEPTDGKGRFAVDGLALDRAYVVCAYATGFTRSEWSPPVLIAVPGGKVKIQLTVLAKPAETPRATHAVKDASPTYEGRTPEEWARWIGAPEPAHAEGAAFQRALHEMGRAQFTEAVAELLLGLSSPPERAVRWLAVHGTASQQRTLALQQHVNSLDRETRLGAVMGLAAQGVGLSSARHVVRDCVAHGERNVKWRVLEYYEALPKPHRAVLLVEVLPLLYEGDALFVGAALEAVVRAGEAKQELIDAIGELLRRPDVAAPAARAAGRLGTAAESLVAPLVAVYRSGDHEAKLRSLQALAAIQTPRAIAVVSEATRDGDPGVRALAKELLAAKK